MKNCRSNFHNAPGPIKRLNKYDSQQPFCPSSLNRAAELEDTGERKGGGRSCLKRRLVRRNPAERSTFFFLINQRRLINLLLWEAVIDLEKNRDFPLNGIIGETIESTSPFEHNVKLFATPTIPIPINPLFFKSSYRTR